MKLTFPDNLQILADNAFRHSDKAMLTVLTGTDDWKSESKTRHAIAKAILSSVGYTEPEPPFQLPTPPPGMEWHRTSGWTAEDLPQGWRPLVLNESIIKRTDEVKIIDKFELSDGSIPFAAGNWNINHYRTRRPLTFTHLGHEWIYHRAGDPMPCDGERLVIVYDAAGHILNPLCGDAWNWQHGNIIGWRYADDKADKIADLESRLAAIKTELDALK